jgi:hypothetical protein
MFLNSKSSMTWLRGVLLPCLSTEGIGAPFLTLGEVVLQVSRRFKSITAHRLLKPQLWKL